MRVPIGLSGVLIMSLGSKYVPRKQISSDIGYVYRKQILDDRGYVFGVFGQRLCPPDTISRHPLSSI
jgi:hypothetical protein